MAMQYSDRAGYDVLTSNYSIICDSSLDPSDVARHLFQSKIVNQGIVDQVGSRAPISKSERIGIVVNAVQRSGAPKAFELFLSAMNNDPCMNWLVIKLKGEYDGGKRVESDGSLDTSTASGLPLYTCRSTSNSSPAECSSPSLTKPPSRSKTEPESLQCASGNNDQGNSAVNAISLFADADKILDEDDLVDVMEEVMDIAKSWRQLGQALRLKNVDLECIASKHSNNFVECLRDTLLAWLQQRYDIKRFGPPTRRALSKAIESRAGANNPALAKKLTKALTM